MLAEESFFFGAAFAIRRPEFSYYWPTMAINMDARGVMLADFGNSWLNRMRTRTLAFGT